MTATQVRRRARPPHIHASTRRRVGVALCAVAAPFVGAAPTGLLPVDWVWAAGLAALVAFLASHSKRAPLLIAAALAAATAFAVSSTLATVVAAIAAALSVRHPKRRVPMVRALAGGATMISLLGSAHSQPPWVIALMWTVVLGPVVVSGYRHLPFHQRKFVGMAACATALFLVLATGLAVAGVYSAEGSVNTGTSAFERGLAAARAGNIDQAAVELQHARNSLGQARDTVALWGVTARLVPGVAQNIDALDAMLDSLRGAASRASLAAGAADVTKLTVTDGHIDVGAISGLSAPLDALAGTLERVVTEVDARIDDPLAPPIRDKMTQLRAVASRSAVDARTGARAASVMPALLGANGPRHYLVLFTSPAEARGRFGFPGSFAEIVITNGKLQLLEHGSVSQNLLGFDPDQSKFDLGDPRLTPYLSLAPTQTMVSATIPPDFNVVAKTAAELWAESGRAPVDGVLRFDPAALAALMRFTGPVAVDTVPAPLTADNLESFLLLGQYIQFPDSQAPRREVLQSVSDVVFERLEHGALPSPRSLVDVFAPLVAAQHVDVVSFTPAENDFLGSLGVTGALPAPASDSLLVSTVNSVGNKIDAFLEQHVAYTADVEPDGHITGTVHVDLHNTAPSSKLPFYVIGNLSRPKLPNGTNRTTLLVYTSAPATDVAVDGVTVPRSQAFTAGRWLNLFTVDLAPDQTVGIDVHVVGKLPAGVPYSLLVHPSGSARPTSYSLTVRQAGRDPILQYEGAVPEPVEYREND